MKNILIVSATLKNNYKLAKKLQDLLENIESNSIKTNIISLENYQLPIYTENSFDEHIDKHEDTISKLTDGNLNLPYDNSEKLFVM